MNPARLPRRAVVGGVLAAGLVGGALSAFAGETAGPCPTWTDPKGDSTTGQVPVSALGDDQMDIVSASLANDGANVIATIGDVKMSASASDFGDEFHINFTLAGKSMQLFSDRGPTAGPAVSPVGFSAGFYNFTDKKSAAATAKYDPKTNSVTITGPVAELAKSLGSDPAGKTATAIVAESQDLLPEAGVGAIYDVATTKSTFTVGASCSGGAAPAPAPSASGSPAPAPSPSGSPTPAPSGSSTPAPGGASGDPLTDYPVADCSTFKDPKGDASYNNTPNDPDLDMTAVTLRTTPDALVTYIKVDKLAAKPTLTDGHRFYSEFTFNKHVFSIAASQFSSYGATVRDTASKSGQVGPMSVVTVDPTTTSPGFTDTKVTSKFDVKNSMVVLSVPRASIEKLGGAPLDAATLGLVKARAGYDSGVLIFVADTVQPPKPEEDVYVVGDNHCFAAAGPAVSPLTNVGVVKAQYGDSAAVAAKLVDGAGAPIAGKTVTFTLGPATVSGSTGSDGVARVVLLVQDKAGRRSLDISSEGNTASVNFTVLVERTVLKAAGSKGGVTATLTDDDRQQVAGQPVTFSSGNKKATVKTNAKGVAKASGFRPGSAVKVSYPGASGMYSAATTSAKA